MASATENPSKQFIEYLDKLKVPQASNTYNITGKSAAHVIAIFKSMVNREGQYGYRGKDNVFTFKIGNPPTISFSIKGNPSDRQPGNGFIYRTGNKGDCCLYDEEFVKQLDEQYDSNTIKFAQDIKLVFKNNSELLKCENNKIIQHVYFLLLFEIGRRLAEDDENVAEDIRKDRQAFDSLPISGAITKIVKLFENKACRFDDVFLKGKKYHCFSGHDPRNREKAIEQLDLKEVQFKDIKELFYEESSQDTTGTDKESSEGAVSGITGGVEALSLSEGSQKESKKPSNKD